MYMLEALNLLFQLREAERPLAVKGPRVQWYRPSSLDQLLALRDKFPHHSNRDLPKYRIVAGNSEIGTVSLLANCLHIYQSV